jgi:hypothetical protein
MNDIVSTLAMAATLLQQQLRGMSERFVWPIRIGALTLRP